MDVRSKTSRRYNSCFATQNACLIFFIALIGCEPAPTPPALKSAKFFQSADGAPVTLDLSGTGVIPAQNTPSFLVLEFDQPLDGDSIETTVCHQVNGKCQMLGGGQYLNKVEVVDKFEAKPGVVTVTAADAKVSYRPDGGYNPPSSTLFDKWPNPGIRIDFPASLPKVPVTVTLTTAIKSQTGAALPSQITFTFNVQ